MQAVDRPGPVKPRACEAARTASHPPRHPERADQVSARWVFAYGSLIWNPGFEYCRTELAQLHGYHRSFCIGSTRYRGTPDKPGVVLGLDRGGTCIGVAFELTDATRESALTEVFRREIPDWAERVYRPTIVRVRIPDGSRVDALAFVAERSSRWYRQLSESELLATLREASGQRGPNRDYAINTWNALQARGVRDGRLEHLARQIAADI